MTTDKTPATLATVKHGGCVQLGDGLPPLPCTDYNAYSDGTEPLFSAQQMRNYARAALSAQPSPATCKEGLQVQPSPGDQRDDSPMAKMAAALRGKAEAERAAFDQRVQSGEWGPMPDNPDVLELPPLPEEVDSVRCMIRGEKGFAEPCDYYFTSKQMRDYARTALAASQPVGEPVAWLVHWSDMPMESPEVTRSASRIAEVSALTHPPRVVPLYAAPPAQAVDLGGIPEGWLLSKKATCYQLSHGNEIIGNLVGPDAEENAAIIARVLDSQAVGK